MHTLHMPGNTTAFDQEGLQETVNHMHTCRAEFLALEQRFRDQPSNT
jgi:hypothetical protein